MRDYTLGSALNLFLYESYTLVLARFCQMVLSLCDQAAVSEDLQLSGIPQRGIGS